MAKLVVNTGAAQGREFELKPGVNSLGRGLTCDFRLEDPSVSAAHAEIIVEAASVTVKDLRSTNGTFINRSQIREGFLQPGQVISLGGVEMLFVAEAAENAAPTGSVARTVALPQIGGIKIARPNALPVAGFRTPVNYPAPMTPAPSLTTIPASVPPTPPLEQGTTDGVEARTWRHVEPVRPQSRGILRCFALGLAAVILSGAAWTTWAATSGPSLAPYAMALTGLICGLAMRLASRNSRAAAYAMLAAGFALLGIFAGAAGQVFALQSISFRDYNLAGLITGLVLAIWIGGGAGLTGKTVRRTTFA